MMTVDALAAEVKPTSAGKGVHASGVKRFLRATLGTRYRLVRQFQFAAFREFRSPHADWRTKLRWWRHGFLADSAALYDFPRDDWRSYVSDYVHDNFTAPLNDAPQFFDQKLMTRALLLLHGYPQAETFALIGRADVQRDPFNHPRVISLAELEAELCKDGGRFILKPQDGGLGSGVYLIESRDGIIVRRRGSTSTPYRLQPAMTTSLVERVVQQHAFWGEIFPDSANTIRVLTLWTPGDAAPFIAAAGQRIGVAATVPKDNFSGGGLAAGIDLSTGVLGCAVRRNRSGRIERMTHHPDTGTRIEGAVLPYWDRIRETVLGAASVVGRSRYIGWDVVVAEQGVPVIIEGNATPGARVVQLQGGLLKNPQVRRFYEVCGIL